MAGLGNGHLIDIYDRLYIAYGPQRWWPGDSEFEVIAGAILTQSASWSNVERALANLKAAGVLSPNGIATLSEGELAELIRPSGYYNAKARKLKAFVRLLGECAGGDLERLLALPAAELRALLLATHGIGPETADSILLYAAGRPVFVIDAYARRILARHRLIDPRAGYEEARHWLEAHLPSDPDLFNEFHALLVAVGKSHCRSRPRCEGCALRFDLRGRRPAP